MIFSVLLVVPPFYDRYWLVVSAPLKNMKVSWDDYSQLNGKIKFMFQTTNQMTKVI